MNASRKSTIMNLLESMNTPISLGCALRLKWSSPKIPYRRTVSELPEISPTNYCDADSYLIDAQAVALLSKNPYYKVKGIDTVKACIDNFMKCEEINRISNIRIKAGLFSNEKTKAVLFTASNIAAKILGKFSYSDPSFGPGSTFTLTGQDCNIITKLGSKLDCTPHAYEECVKLILERMPLYAVSCGLVERTKHEVFLHKHEVDIVMGDRFSTVPKNYKTDRPICIQPGGNMLLQKAIAQTIRRRLKRAGLDLDYAHEDHKAYAEAASIYEHLCTVDFRSASDTICIELVRAVIPPEWFDAMNLCRTRKTIFNDGSSISLEKFSAMGNGYTFELESLIFFCIALACRTLYGQKDDIISVFGDDVIITPNIVDVFIKTMTDLGLEVNTEKTFIKGPFRESCGGDYYNGFSVRPIYIKEHNEKIDGNFYLLNRISSIASVLSFNVYRDKRFYAEWGRILSRIPHKYRIFGPEELGDQVIYGNCRGKTKAGIRQYKVIVKKSRYFKPRSSQRDLVLASALYGVPSTGVIPRGVKYSVQIRTVACVANGCIRQWL